MLERRFKEKEELIGPENMREAERIVMLNVIDNQWKDHLLSMDHLKEGIGLRGYGQKDPLIEYKKESFDLFQDMMDRIEDETIRYLFFLQVTPGPPPARNPAMAAAVACPAAQARASVLGRRRGIRGRRRRRNEEALVAANAEQRRAAQSAVEDFTRNIQRKKDKEMAELQFVGGSDTTTEKKQAVSEKKAGRNDPCPAAAAKNTRNATEPDLSRAFCFRRLRRHLLAGRTGWVSA